MRFMILRKADTRTESDTKPSDELLAAIGKYAEEMAEAGVLRGGEGLRPTSSGARVQFADGKATVIDGPFTETKELLAGYFSIDVPSKDDAIAWAKRWPPLDGDVQLEIRQVVEPEDCVATATIRREVDLRKELARAS